MLRRIASRAAATSAALMMASGCGGAPRHDTASTERKLTSGGLERMYRLYVPPAVRESGERVPLLLAFHGRFGTGAQMEGLTGFDALADAHRFVVAYPDGVDRAWNTGSGGGPAERRGVDDVGFVRAILDDVARELPIDAARVYAAGMSYGGAFVNRLGCELADRIVAIAPVAGTMPLQVASHCLPSRPVAMIMFHGHTDDMMPFAGGEVRGGGMVLSAPASAASLAQRNRCKADPVTRPAADGVRLTTYGDCQCGADVELHEMPAGGHAWPGGHDRPGKRARGKSIPRPDASAEVWRFFTAHTRSHRCR